jgi:hypothetical protein
MQQTTVQVLPGGGVQIGTPQAQQPMRPLSNREMDAIRERRSDISTQLTSAMSRRNNMIEEMSDAPEAAKQGYLEQVQVLDQRIVSIERDMEESGRMLRTGLTADNGYTLVAPQERGFESMSEDAQIAIGVSFSLFFLLPLALGLTRMMWRRSKRTEAKPAAEQDQRMERLEQAVDAIALEIERVGESQRYQQKVLAEANMMPAMSSSSRSPEPVRVSDYGSRDR